jgi:hypothetical protein
MFFWLLGSLLFFFFFFLSDGQGEQNMPKKQNANADGGTTSGDCWCRIFDPEFVRNGTKIDT